MVRLKQYFKLFCQNKLNHNFNITNIFIEYISTIQFQSITIIKAHFMGVGGYTSKGKSVFLN